MIDTLYVAINALPDTLKLALQSSDNSSFYLHVQICINEI